MGRVRNKTGKFITSNNLPKKKKKNSRSSFFNWFNDRLNVKNPVESGLKNDHENYTPAIPISPEYICCEVAVDGVVDSNRNESWKDGRRVLELGLLATNMYCCSCNSPLHLSDTVGEKLFGLGGILFIRCPNSLCQRVNDVQMGKRAANGSYDINRKAAIGMVHAGIGPTHLQSFLSECNLPSISGTTLRKKEKELSQQIHDVALKSCKEAQQDEMPESGNEVEVSFDGGWQKRGSGWNYNSSTGHACMIGKKTGKVLMFDKRSRLCKICEYHFSRKETVPEHDCVQNWQGSSKAMESDMAVSIAHSLKDGGCEIKVLHADNDCTTMAKLGLEFEDIEKRDDQNHVKKGLSSSLHAMSKRHKELQNKDTLQYILRCYMYAIKGGETEDYVKSALDRIVPHIFGSHENCREIEWCTFHSNPSGFKFKSLPNGKPLSSDSLKEELLALTTKYKSRSGSLISLGSTQANESFNQLVSTKAPKARHYGGSCSLQNRLSAAVLQKNEGYKYLSKVNEAVNLSPGEFTCALSTKLDRQKKQRKQMKSTTKFKRSRIQLKKKRNTTERKNLVREGKTYETGIEFTLTDKPDDTIEIPPPMKFSGNEAFIFFDLETTGLGRNSDIIQIAAISNDEHLFQRYIIPRVEIQIEASRVTGITYSHSTNHMYVRGKRVEPVTLYAALVDFIEFLKTCNDPLLTGHNICNFDIPILNRKLKEMNLYSSFCSIVKGFIDTMKVARKVIPKDEVTNYKQQTLVDAFLNTPYVAHDAVEDVKALKSLYYKKISSLIKNEDLFSIHYHCCSDSYSDLIQKKIVTKSAGISLARHGISLKHLKLAFERDKNGLNYIFEDRKIPKKGAQTINKFFSDEE